MKSNHRLLFAILLAGLVSVAVFPEEPRGPIAHYVFGEGRGEVLHDRSGNGHHGVIAGATWTSRDGVQCLNFDGSGDYVDFGDDAALKLAGDATFSAWVRLDASPFPDETTNWTIVDCEEYRKSGFLVRIDGATAKVMYRSSQDGADQHGFGGTALENGRTAFVAVSRCGERVVIYVNGRRDAEFAAKAPDPGPVSFKISAPGQSFAGTIQELSVYDRALRDSEIIDAYWRGAGRCAQDTLRGRIQITPHIYHDEAQAFVEVDTFGVQPLQDTERVLVQILKNDNTVAVEMPVDASAGKARAAVALDLRGLPEDTYLLRAVLESPAREASDGVGFHYPAAPFVPPSPRKKTAAALPEIVPPPAYEARAAAGGGLTIEAAGRELAVESVFSVPGGGWNTFGVDDEAMAAANSDWRISTDQEYAVSATGAHYGITRRVTPEPDRLVVRDTVSNASPAPVGLLIRHRLAGPASDDAVVYVGGRATVKPVARRSINRSPTLLLSSAGLGAGLVPVDDVFIVQSRGAYDGAGQIELSTDEFALDAGASYTLEWAVYLNSTGDYFDMVNAIRRNEGRNNVRVDGALAFLQGTQQKRDASLIPGPEYFEQRNAAYATVFCLSWCTDDPGISVEGIEFVEHPLERRRIREMMDRLYAVRPNIKGMFHVAHQLYATNRPDELFPDSRVLDATGNQTVYPNDYGSGNYFSRERYEQNWRWWIFYPTLENSFGKAMLDSVEVMMDEMGCRGVFADGFLWGYGGEYTYDRWDGRSADIDPVTHEITRKKGSVLLLSQDAMIAWCRKIWGKGGVVIANGVVPTRTICSLPLMTDKEVNEGPDVPLLPTPITLSDPALAGTEEGLYRDVLNKLRWGNLYAYYNEPVTLSFVSLPQQMYPITVEEAHAGCVKGKERIITMNSGVYGWPGARDLHMVYHFDSRGHRVQHDFITTADGASVRTEIVLEKDETAAIVRIPLQIGCDSPVNVLVRQHNARETLLDVNGSGNIRLTGPDGVERAYDLDGPRALTLQL